MDAFGTLDKDGTSHSRLTLVVRGDVELGLRAAFHQTAPAQYNLSLIHISCGCGVRTYCSCRMRGRFFKLSFSLFYC